MKTPIAIESNKRRKKTHTRTQEHRQFEHQQKPKTITKNKTSNEHTFKQMTILLR